MWTESVAEDGVRLNDPVTGSEAELPLRQASAGNSPSTRQ